MQLIRRAEFLRGRPIIESREPQAVTVEQAAAASWSLPAGHYTLNYLTGRWPGSGT